MGWFALPFYVTSPSDITFGRFSYVSSPPKRQKLPDILTGVENAAGHRVGRKNDAEAGLHLCKQALVHLGTSGIKVSGVYPGLVHH